MNNRHVVDVGYPRLTPLQDILKAWNPDNITVPQGFVEQGPLRVFDYSVRTFGAWLLCILYVAEAGCREAAVGCWTRLCLCFVVVLR